MSLTAVPNDHPARRATLGDQLRRNALRNPNREAIVSLASPAGERRALTYRELNSQVNKLASALAARGVGRGDVVAIMGRNCPEHIVAFWAAIKLGAACTGVNYTFTAREITYQVSHSGAKAIVVEDEFVSKIDELEDPLPDLELRIVNDAYGNEASSDWERLSGLVESGEDVEPDVEVSSDDLAIIPYTSGTTALPKAVAIPHRNYIVSMIPSYTTGIGLIEDDVWFYTMPFHTIAGMGMQIALLSLCNTIVYPFKTDPVSALAAFVDERVTIIGQTPTFYLQVMGAPGFDDADLSPVRRCITYGGTMPQSMFDAFGRVAPNAGWVTLWSQSEITQTPSIGHFRGLDDIPGGDPTWIGKPTAQLEVRVVDEDDNDVSEGELAVRSPGLMQGYYKDPERTAEVMKNGWLHTGDLVRIDADGNLFFVDRKKDLIKTGGMNVSSQEVERILYQHPDLLEVAVVGVAHEYWSQAVTAFVTARPGRTPDPDHVIAFCKEQLAGYKVPKAVHVVDALPKDTQGKILKRELRDGAAAKAAAPAAS
jgi:acyl-CoA synthetase (AMP-forming)/AMP-acid ligase II